MEYERIHRPLSPQSGGGFSPKKLRAMLLGVEKKRKEEEELEAKSSLRPETAELDDRRSSAADSYKDVECSTSTEMSSGAGQRSRDYILGGTKVRSQEEDPFDLESVSSGFEFQKAERGPSHYRSTPAAAYVPPFSKPLPSKWDDAQKWIASPTSNRGSKAAAGQAKRGSLAGYGGRMGPAKVVLEVEEADTKRVDGIQTKKDLGGSKAMNSASEPYPVLDPVAKPASIADNPVADSAVNINRHDSSAVHSTTTFITPAPTVKSVSMRDMGTEMTPIASQEPSRTGTPVRATSPLQSPGSSRPSTPQRRPLDLTQVESADWNEDTNNKEMSDKELQKKTRKEIMALGQQLGKTNIAAWASKEEAKTNASMSLKTLTEDQSPRSVIEVRAAAWEEAEKAKYLARFKREEIKIQAWENHQKAKAEAEMRKIEVEVERMRARSHERLLNQLAAARHKAEEKRSAAEAKRNKQAAKTAEQADYIRKTGQIPSSFSCWGWCSSCWFF